uniref:Uncharacterized protein n=1 Tax=Oryza meridionalis TaxID=40149 RepID=A0A0E0ENK5_9ORYZ
MAESLLFPLVRGLVGKAIDTLVKSAMQACGVDDDRRTLQRHLLGVQSMLSDAELKSETNDAVKLWMKDLKAVAYKADDVLDDFQYEALRREAHISDSTTRKVLGYFTPHSPLLFRATMSRKLNNVLKKINELVEEMNKFGLVEHTEPPHLPYRQTHSALDEPSDIFGRDNDKGEVVKLLLDQRDEHKLQVLPVVGMGGLGKTTFAKMVYNDSSVHEHFQLKMWHCVSDNFEAGSLLKSIVELATDKTCQLLDTIELLRRQLEEAIGRRRFLLVLDDEASLSSQLGATEWMGTFGPYELRCLNEDDSWEVFSKRAFGKQVKEQAELVSIGTRIVKKCRGVPLALKTMGGLMSSKQSVSAWEVIAESNIGASVQGKNDVMDILKLSYRHLSPEMKQCFAFCAIFPQDYEMVKDELIQLWMANGFIQEEETMDLTHKGEMIFHDLVWRSFLQDVKEKRIHYYECDSIVCKMHDLMHDLAKDVTDECASTTKELDQLKGSIKDVRHLRIPEEMEETMTELFKGTSSLHTLIDRSWRSTLWNVSVEFNLASVRVLRCSVINSAITNAKHLRFLDLSETSIVTLPDSICMLYNLQSLRLNRCHKLEYLPTGCGIEELKDMRHLTNRLELYNLHKVKSEEKAKQANMYQKRNLSEVLFFWGREERYMPNDNAYNEEQAEGCGTSLQIFPKLKKMFLRNLPNLERWAVNISGEPNSFIVLPQLKILGISDCPKLAGIPDCPVLRNLDINRCSNIVISSLAHVTSLSYLSYDAEGFDSMTMPLGSWSSLIRLEVRGPTKPRRKCSRKSSAFEAIWPQMLHDGIRFLRIAPWDLGHFAFVEHLEIRDCHDIVRLPTEELRCLIRLRSLHIVGFTNLGINFSLSEEILYFSCLEELNIVDCSGIVEIPKLPASLETLYICSCQNLVVPLPPNLGNLASLRNFIVINCESLKLLPDGMDGLTSLRKIRLAGCPGIEKFPEGLLQRLPTLESLHLYSCSDQLLRRCKEGGEYFDLLSSIPDISNNISSKVLRKKKLAKRLLPFR